MKNLTTYFYLFALCLFAAAPTFADTPSNVRTKNERTFEFGSIRITQSFDSSKDPADPEFKLMVYGKDSLLMQLRDVAFDNFYASPDKRLFVGLSNSGWPRSAAIIFDERGRILLLADHMFGNFDYCNESPTMLKEWYSRKNPQIRFPVWDPVGNKAKEGKLPGILINDCHERSIDLLDLLSKANADANSQIREQIYFLYSTR